MAVGDIYRMTNYMNWNDRIVSTDQYYEETVIRTGSVAEVSFQLAGVAETAFFTTFWSTFASDDLTYNRTVVQKISPTRDAPFTSLVLANNPGLIAQEGMNAQTAVLVAQYTGTWTREFFGRSFLPGFAETQANQGRVKTATMIGLQIAATIFYIADFTLIGPAGGTFTAGVLSPKRLKAATPPFIHPLITATVRPRISRQVRRKTLATGTTV